MFFILDSLTLEALERFINHCAEERSNHQTLAPCIGEPTRGCLDNWGFNMVKQGPAPLV